MSMWNFDGWEQITCAESDTILNGITSPKVWSSLTDPDGNFGVRVIFTEWGDDTSPLMRSYVYQGTDPYRPCEHYKQRTGS